MCDVCRLRFQTALRAVYTRRVRPRISFEQTICRSKRANNMLEANHMHMWLSQVELGS
jgi:hypothetical protein